ncbi:MAG: type II secretion system protein [Deltaproteobacteria bacterium]|nr:type II secretion system protein [Candidatus Anaeroferrophillacea bacterium]
MISRSDFHPRPAIPAPGRGFTLIEMLVVMVIVSLGVTLVVTAIGRGTGERRGGEFVEAFAGLCRRARVGALAGGRTAVLLVDGNRRRCRLGDEDEEGGLEIPADMLVEVEDRAEPVDAGATNYEILFFPDGSSTGDRLIFSVAGREVAALCLDPLTGAVRLRRGEERKR